MEQRRLGTSDLTVGEVGYGTMSLSGGNEQSFYMIHEAIDRGVNFIDTADLYQFGAIEETVGKAIKDRRDDVILATKGGNHWESGKEGWYWDPSKSYIKEACKQSLKRLGTDYIDLYQLHGGTIDDPIDETIEAFEELVEEGYIRYYGISSIRPNVIREYVERSNIVSVMMQYSMLDRRPEESVLSLLKENNVSVITRGPVAKGILSNKGLHKIPDKGYLTYSADELRRLIPQLQDAVAESYEDLATAAICYSLMPEAVGVTIPGASSEQQLNKNINAAEAPMLTPEQMAGVRALTKENIYDKHR